MPLLIVTTVTAPLGVVLLRFVPVTTVWWMYTGVLVFLAYRMARPPRRQDDSQPPVITNQNRVVAGVLGGLIGVPGPGASGCGAAIHLFSAS